MKEVTWRTAICKTLSARFHLVERNAGRRPCILPFFYSYSRMGYGSAAPGLLDPSAASCLAQSFQCIMPPRSAPRVAVCPEISRNAAGCCDNLVARAVVSNVRTQPLMAFPARGCFGIRVPVLPWYLITEPQW